MVGYRDIEAAESEGLPWIVDNEFVREPSELKAQLSALQANGGGDEPESLLDTLYKVATMEAKPRARSRRSRASGGTGATRPGSSSCSPTPRSRRR